MLTTSALKLTEMDWIDNLFIYKILQHSVEREENNNRNFFVIDLSLSKEVGYITCVVWKEKRWSD